MSLNQLDNCPKCGKLFVRGIRDVCKNCLKTEEEEYRRVAEYLRKRENRKATLYECSEETDVSIKQITKFIRQRRITVNNMPNMGFPCESCGTMIQEGTLCTDCQSSLTKDVHNVMKQEQQRAEQEKHSIKDAGYRQVKNDER